MPEVLLRDLLLLRSLAHVTERQEEGNRKTEETLKGSVDA